MLYLLIRLAVSAGAVLLAQWLFSQWGLIAVDGWVIALIFCAASRRLNGMWLIGLWIVFAGMSYVERQHHYFDFAVAAFLVSLLWHRRQVVLVILLIVIARPLDGVMRRASGQHPGDGDERSNSRLCLSQIAPDDVEICVGGAWRASAPPECAIRRRLD